MLIHARYKVHPDTEKLSHKAHLSCALEVFLEAVCFGDCFCVYEKGQLTVQLFFFFFPGTKGVKAGKQLQLSAGETELGDMRDSCFGVFDFYGWGNLQIWRCGDDMSVRTEREGGRGEGGWGGSGVKIPPQHTNTHTLSCHREAMWEIAFIWSTWPQNDRLSSPLKSWGSIIMKF